MADEKNYDIHLTLDPAIGTDAERPADIPIVALNRLHLAGAQQQPVIVDPFPAFQLEVAGIEQLQFGGVGEWNDRPPHLALDRDPRGDPGTVRRQ